MMTYISVIIPTFNRANHVLEAVQSVLKQTRRPDEILLIDDGSTDQTRTRLQPFMGEIRYFFQKQSGVSAARNLGIREAKGEWLAFLDSDDLWKPKKLQRQVDLLQSIPLKVCYTDEEWRKNGTWMNQKKKHRKVSGFIYAHCLPLCIISPSSVIVHRSVFETAGLFDESLPACEDYDLWLRISSRFEIAFIPERLIVKRAGSWPQLSEQAGLDKYRICALKKMLSQDSLDADLRIKTYDMLAEKCRIYALGCRKHQRSEEAEWAERMLQEASA